MTYKMVLCRFAVCLTLVLLPIAGSGQVTFQNPRHLAVPQGRPEILYRVTLRVVARDLQMKSATELQFPVTVVLGEANEYYSADEEKQQYVIYLNKWKDEQFVASLIRLAVNRVVTRERRTRMLQEIMGRANGIGPISAQELKEDE